MDWANGRYGRRGERRWRIGKGGERKEEEWGIERPSAQRVRGIGAPFLKL